MSDFSIYIELYNDTHSTLKFNTDMPLKVIILSVILELPLSVRGVGRRTQNQSENY
jgi:hypothetical protein